MRTIEETRERWKILFTDNETPSDLRAALQTELGGNLCNEGLRSICWKVFLLFEGFDRKEWPKKLAESRDAYGALRAHFLKFIEHPDDLESTVDPLADDEQSPWQTLRDDEKLRAEISQDVDRCMQENHFFQEPATKSKLTDILFVYSKLNPDVGYRQGMHELLAPILWVIDRDTVSEPAKGSTADPKESLMLDLLDSKFVEHDSFALFLCVMQTARVFYEHGEGRSASGKIDVIPIVNRCQFLHQEALMIIDHELAEHLQAVDVLPQIFLTRWMRLLFGREYPFDDVLTMWDLLIAHGLRSDLVDFTCIAMLLRIRWPLLKADYSGALSLLLRYPSPEPYSPQTFVHDALYLEQNPTAETGSFLISKYSGREPESAKRYSRSNMQPARKAYLWDEFRKRSENISPVASPARGSPKSLEALFQDVSQGIQRRTESWGVAKAVRGAVTEARKNMQTMHYEPGPSRPRLPSVARPSTAPELEFEKRISLLEKRNQALANALGDALKDLRLQLANTQSVESTSTGMEQALARAELVQICLEDPSRSLPVVSPPRDLAADGEPVETITPPTIPIANTPSNAEEPVQPNPSDAPRHSTDAAGCRQSVSTGIGQAKEKEDTPADSDRDGPRPLVRPSLADAGFSWMLEGSRNHLSSFVSSASVPPEQIRHQDSPRTKGSPLFGGSGEEKKPGTIAEYDELALRSLRGSGGPL